MHINICMAIFVSRLEKKRREREEVHSQSPLDNN